MEPSKRYVLAKALVERRQVLESVHTAGLIVSTVIIIAILRYQIFTSKGG